MLLSQLIGEAYRLYQKRFIIIYACILFDVFLVCESDDEDSGYLDEWDDNYGQDGNNGSVEKNMKTDAINDPLPSPT